jgi:NADH:ubiquinone oxidoreductase subunit 6 (subunit J)
MMLDLKTETVKEYNFINSSEFFLITYCLLYYILINSNFIHLFSTNFIVNEQFNNNLDSFFNIDIFGQSLFNYFIPCFLIAGLVLLVAMLGAIVLTLRFSANRKNQISSKQLSKNNMFLSYYN